MKKLAAIFMALAVAISCASFACVSAEEATEAAPQEEITLGGWTAPESPEITQEIQALCDKAFEGLLGVNYVPAVLLGTQIVSGTNYRILFLATPVSPEAKETYAIGTIYEDLEGNVELTELLGTDVETNFNGSLGGWTQSESPAMTEEAQQAFEQAMEGLVGVDYKPVALLGSQVTNGANYAILCEATVVYPDAEPYYAIVYVYKAPDEDAELSDIVSLEAEEASAEESEEAAAQTEG